jgi:hypothetical protein
MKSKILKFKKGDRVDHKTFGKGTIDEIQMTPWGEKVYLISIDGSKTGRSVEVKSAEKEYILLKGN